MVREKPCPIIPADFERDALVGHKAITGIELMGREWLCVKRRRTQHNSMHAMQPNLALHLQNHPR